MKILLLAENWPPRVGGIERYLFGLTTELAKHHEITVIAPLVDAAHDFALPKGMRLIQKRFFWPILRPAWLPLYISIHRLVQTEKFDLVLCGKGLFEGLVGYYLKKYLKIPYLVFTYYMEISEWQKKPSALRKLTRVLSNADHVVIITEALRKTIESLGAAPKTILKIHPAVSFGFVQSLNAKPRADVLEKYNIQRPYILALGRLIERKGFGDLISAFAKLDQTKFGDVQFVIVGDGPQRGELKKIAEQEYVRPIFTGNVPDEDLPALYAHAGLFALTPKEMNGDIEGFGIVYLEAAAAGIPVVGTKTGGVPEAVADGITGLLVEPGDVDGMAEAMTRLLKDPDFAQRLGDAGRDRVQDMFTWKQQAHLLQGVIQHD